MKIFNVVIGILTSIFALAFVSLSEYQRHKNEELLIYIKSKTEAIEIELNWLSNQEYMINILTLEVLKLKQSAKGAL